MERDSTCVVCVHSLVNMVVTGMTNCWKGYPDIHDVTGQVAHDDPVGSDHLSSLILSSKLLLQRVRLILTPSELRNLSRYLSSMTS